MLNKEKCRKGSLRTCVDRNRFRRPIAIDEVATSRNAT